MVAKLFNSKFLFFIATLFAVQVMVNAIVAGVNLVQLSSLPLFVGTMALTIVIAKVVWKTGSPLEFVNVVDHEMSHSLFAFLFQRKVVELYANSNGTGHVMYDSEASALSARLTSLAPYLISVGTVLVTVIQLVGAAHLFVPLTVLGGIVTGYRTVSLFKDARPHQSDFARTGYTWAIVLILVSYVLFLLLQLTYTSGGTESVVALFRISGEETAAQLIYLGENCITFCKWFGDVIMDWSGETLVPLFEKLGDHGKDLLEKRG